MSDSHEAHPKVNYFAVFVALCIFTLISFFLDLFRGQLGRTILASAVLGVATCKAMYVMMYFMHLRFEGARKYILLAPTMVLAMALPFILAPDIAFHYYSIQVPQTMIPESDHIAEAHAPEDPAHRPGHNAPAPADTPHAGGTPGPNEPVHIKPPTVPPKKAAAH